MKYPELLKLWKLCRIVADGAKNCPCETMITPIGDIAAIVRENGQIKIVIDGTNTGKEWISNFKFFRTGKWFTHKGFYEAALSFFYQIQAKKIAIRGNFFHIIGHSRGGSTGLILAALLAEMGALVKVTSFGAPKSGSHIFAKKCSDLSIVHTRVYGDRDPVPNIPPFPWWKHYDTERIILPEVGEHDPYHEHVDYGEWL